MSVLTMVKNLKEIHPEYLLCFKVGSFYHSYGKDAYILSYIFDYRLKSIGKDNISSCGFPKNSLSKVEARLEQNKINYLILDTKNEYNVDDKMEFGNLNKYDEIFSKSNKYVRIRRKLNELVNDLLLEFDEEKTILKIREIEKIVYEKRKI